MTKCANFAKEVFNTIWGTSRKRSNKAKRSNSNIENKESVSRIRNRLFEIMNDLDNLDNVDSNNNIPNLFEERGVHHKSNPKGTTLVHPRCKQEILHPSKQRGMGALRREEQEIRCIVSDFNKKRDALINNRVTELRHKISEPSVNTGVSKPCGCTVEVQEIMTGFDDLLAKLQIGTKSENIKADVKGIETKDSETEDIKANVIEAEVDITEYSSVFTDSGVIVTAEDAELVPVDESTTSVVGYLDSVGSRIQQDFDCFYPAVVNMNTIMDNHFNVSQMGVDLDIYTLKEINPELKGYLKDYIVWYVNKVDNSLYLPVTFDNNGKLTLCKDAEYQGVYMLPTKCVTYENMRYFSNDLINWLPVDIFRR